jgi:hypothetical protein
LAEGSFRGRSLDTGFDGKGDCWGVRVGLLMGGGLAPVVDEGAGDEAELEVGVEVSRRDFGAGGPK